MNLKKFSENTELISGKIVFMLDDLITFLGFAVNNKNRQFVLFYQHFCQKIDQYRTISYFYRLYYI